MIHKYIGAGDYLPGIPARDLSAAEYKQYKQQIEANYKATGRRLYETKAVADSDTSADEAEEKP